MRFDSHHAKGLIKGILRETEPPGTYVGMGLQTHLQHRNRLESAPFQPDHRIPTGSAPGARSWDLEEESPTPIGLEPDLSESLIPVPKPAATSLPCHRTDSPANAYSHPCTDSPRCPS